MKYYIGADLGTSSLKLLLVDEQGAIVRSISEEYPVYYPQPTWSEQRPEDWWSALCRGVPRLCQGIDVGNVAAMGVGGQMHGLVTLDSADAVIRPVILWNDGRTAKQTAELNGTLGEDELLRRTANIAFAGFTAPKLLWMHENEPELFARIAKIMLPKDYLNYRLTGEHVSDYSDAAGMLLLDVEHKCWSASMLALCGISEAQMPTLHESFDVVGHLTAQAADALGLVAGIPVVAGAGDNAAAAVGTGALSEGACNLSLGTSGTVFIPYDRFVPSSNGSIHNFCHAGGAYHLMGCVLSAASCNKWFYEDILGTDDYAGEQKDIGDDMLGKGHVYFLPYLMGERSPINDTDARGCFIGMRADTARRDMVLAVLEGVAFAMKQSVDIAKESGIKIDRVTICGGGARSPLWVKIFANVLNMPISIPKTEEGPGYGAAMLAMVGEGRFGSVAECAAALLSVRDTVYPDAEISARYAVQYEKFKLIYPALKNTLKELR